MQGASLTMVVGKGQEPNEKILNLVPIHPSIDNGGDLAGTVHCGRKSRGVEVLFLTDGMRL